MSKIHRGLSGAVIPGASIDVVNEATGTTKAATANDLGEFAIPYVPVGRYTITVGSEGFSTHEQTGINLTSGQKVDLTFVLEVGATTETVSVSAEAPLLNTTSAEQDINLDSDQVDELPMRNRDITSIIALGTGAASDGLTISLNGLPPGGFTFAVDGVNAVPDSEFASLAAYQNYNFVKGISVEAVQGVEVSKNIFSAERSPTPWPATSTSSPRVGPMDSMAAPLSNTRRAASTPTTTFLPALHRSSSTSTAARLAVRSSRTSCSSSAHLRAIAAMRSGL